MKIKFERIRIFWENFGMSVNACVYKTMYIYAMCVLGHNVKYIFIFNAIRHLMLKDSFMLQRKADFFN